MRLQNSHIFLYKPCLTLGKRFHYNPNLCNSLNDSSRISVLWKKPVFINYFKQNDPKVSIFFSSFFFLHFNGIHSYKLFNLIVFNELKKLHREIHRITCYSSFICNYVKKNQRSSNFIDPGLPSESQLYELMNYFVEKAPKLFSDQGWTYDKCSEKIIFQNMMFFIETSTKRSYIAQINILKMIMKSIFEKPELSVVRITKNSQDGTIHIRWQIQGIPWWLKVLTILNDNHSQYMRYIDGFSVFYIKSDGLYHKHILMKMTPLRNENKESTLSSFLTKIGYFSPDLEPLPKSASLPIENKMLK
nr:uncharacterized protein LOC100211419 isoform X1 [Hydra vulgaris]